MLKLATFEATVLGVVVPFLFSQPNAANDPAQVIKSGYFPPPESQGGWRKIEKKDDIRGQAGMNPDKLDDLRNWLLKSDQRDFAAVVIRNGIVVLEVERGNSSRTDSRRVASVSKAISWPPDPGL